MGEKKPLILVVEDETFIADEVVSALNASNRYSAISANNGLQALEKLKENETLLGNKIACIVLDIRMPEMDGLTFLETWRKKEKMFQHIPVIMLTAYEDAEKWDSFIKNAISFFFAEAV